MDSFFEDMKKQKKTIYFSMNHFLITFNGAGLNGFEHRVE
jgi:hypothetical protein